MIRGSSSLLCLVATTAFVVRAIKHRHIREFARRLTFVLILCNCAAAWLDITEIILYPDVHCKTVGFFRGFIVLSALLWSLVLTINVYLMISRGRDLRRHELRLHCCVWPFAFGVSLLPSIGDTWGYAGFW